VLGRDRVFDEEVSGILSLSGGSEGFTFISNFLLGDLVSEWDSLLLLDTRSVDVSEDVSEFLEVAISNHAISFIKNEDINHRKTV
jgi:hypothetical protein